MTTNVPAPMKAVRPMENRTLKRLSLFGAQVEAHCSSARLALLLTGNTARHCSEKKAAVRFGLIVL